jgi:tRNA-binding EMAP/Myf-like protein
MTAWYPNVVRIEKIEKHPNADALEIATVLNDFPVIMKFGQYKLNQLVGYIPIDSIVSDTEQFHFLSPVNRENYEENNEIKSRIIGPKYPVGSVPEKYRIIKAKKIRNIYSMGMLVDVPSEMKEGDSIIELLSLKKWEEEVDDNVEMYNARSKSKGANAAKPPSGWSIPYYDIESLRKYLTCLDNEQDIVLSEKINGSNACYTYDGEKLWCKSRNFYKKPDEADMWCNVGSYYKLEEKLSKYPMLGFFAELYGQVKKFHYNAVIENGVLRTRLAFFDILNINSGRFLDYDDMMKILNELELPSAPLLYRGPWLGKEQMYPYAEGQSTLNSKIIREGFVLKPAKERFEPKLGNRLILKLVGEGYSLSK